jgi:hypothetical protein
VRGQTLWPLRTARPQVRRAVALLGGNLDDLPLLRAARLASALHDASVQFCWTPGSEASPARPLVTELARDAGLEELPRDAFSALLYMGRLDSVMLAPALWRRLAGSLWRRLHRTPAYICRNASLPPASVLCCADSDATAARLRDRLANVFPELTNRVTLLRAQPPPSPWILGMLAVVGCGLPAEDDRRQDFENVAGIPELVIRAPAARAAVEALSTTETSLLVLGWHQHALPLPERWLHPVAWRLSTSSPSDVLLVPLGAGP